MVMTVEKRRGKILHLIRSDQSIANAAIAESLSVPAETVRNDLIALEQEGIIKRLHGHSQILKPQAALRRLIRSGALKPEERRDEILKYISEKREARVATLAQIFGVTDVTIRSDLAALEERGAIRRDHGRACFIRNLRESALIGALGNGDIPSDITNVGRWIIGNIQEGDVVCLDGSDYGIFAALNLGENVGAIIITNSLRVAMILENRGYTSDVYLLPGNINEKMSTDLRFYESVIEHFLVSKAFIAASGFDFRQGVLFNDIGQFELFSAISRYADHLFIALRSSTLGDRASFTVPLRRIESKLREIIVDDRLSVERAESVFPENTPVVLCGENYTLTSPFNRQYIIGFSSLYGEHEFSRTVRQSIESAARKRPDIELVITDNRLDPDVTIANIETFIEKKVDLVIEYQHEYRLGPLIVEKLSHADIPIIAIDIPIPGAVYFGVNNYKAGLLAGENALAEIRNRWNGTADKIVTLTDAATGPISENRIAGMLEVILPAIGYPKSALVNVETTNDPGVAERDTGAAIETFAPDDRIVILAFNDVVCIGALAAIRAQNRASHTIAVSHSHIRSISKELARNDSPLVGSVAFFPERYGEKIIDIAVKILRKEAVPPNNYTEHQWAVT